MKLIYLSLAALLFAVSCTKFDDININPNVPSQASGTQLIANAETSLPFLLESPQGEFAAQFLSETQYPNASLYPEGSSSFYWLYTGPMMDLHTVINSQNLLPGEGPIANQIAVAKTLMAYYLWHTTDRWGDVPYTDAFRGKQQFHSKI